MSQAFMFPDAPPAREPVPADMIRGAEVEGDYRWTLTRAWRSGPPLCWIMLNPSTADGRHDDPTIRRCIQFTHRWKFPGLVVVNLYPFRSSSPAACKAWAARWTAGDLDLQVRDAMQRNARVIAERVETSAAVIAAWGAGAWDEHWVDHITEGIQENMPSHAPIWCLGKTASGAPVHPLARGVHRVPDDAPMQVWRKAV